jgi:hypothetical protein
MPRLNELQSSYSTGHVSPTHSCELAVEETLVPDRRSRQSTSQMLEDKLRRLASLRRDAGQDEPRPFLIARP